MSRVPTWRTEGGICRTRPKAKADEDLPLLQARIPVLCAAPGLCPRRLATPTCCYRLAHLCPTPESELDLG